jgi:hypothetical protein
MKIVKKNIYLLTVLCQNYLTVLCQNHLNPVLCQNYYKIKIHLEKNLKKNKNRKNKNIPGKKFKK